MPLALTDPSPATPTASASLGEVYECDEGEVHDDEAVDDRPAEVEDTPVGDEEEEHDQQESGDRRWPAPSLGTARVVTEHGHRRQENQGAEVPEVADEIRDVGAE